MLRPRGSQGSYPVCGQVSFVLKLAEVRLCYQFSSRVAIVREKYLENEFFSRSGKSQGIL